MSSDKPERMRVALKQREAEIVLQLRWDKAPKTCAAVVQRLPVEGPVWHAKYANNEIYTLIPAFDPAPPDEWLCAFPAPGDFMSIPIPPGVHLPEGGIEMDMQRGVIDLAYFYDRGNSLLHSPSGPIIGSIFATALSLEDIWRFAKACHDVCRGGSIGESLVIEAA